MLRVPRIISTSVGTLLNHVSSTSDVARHSITSLSVAQKLQNLQENAIPREFLKWVSLGSSRTSKFATGYTPLQPKPLDQILDMERANDRSTEDLVSIWDDKHLGRGHIASSMRAKLYHLLEQRAADCRYFVIPVWRGSGYTTMFAQDATHALHWC